MLKECNCIVYQLDDPIDTQLHRQFFYRLWNIETDKQEEVFSDSELMKLLGPLVKHSKEYEILSITTPNPKYVRVTNQAELPISKDDFLGFITKYRKRIKKK